MTSWPEGRCREIVRARSGGFCELAIDEVCHGRAVNMHHRVKKGRVWRPSNVLDACGSGTTGCHGYVEANPRWANEEGLWLRSEDGDPAQVAAHIRWVGQRSWWVLDDLGMLTWDGGTFEPLRLRRYV